MFFPESIILYDITFVFVFYRITMELTFFFLDDLISACASLLQSHNGILVFIAFFYDLTFCLFCCYRIAMVLALIVCVCFALIEEQWYIGSGCFS
jgi:hypothetical protein